MNIFEGLEKFGLSSGQMDDLFSDDKQETRNGRRPQEEAAKEVKAPEEEDFLFEKSIRCVVCDNVFATKAIKSSKLRRLGADKDLRPKYQSIDANKYDVVSCPYCGYTALSRYFDHLSTLQIRLIREGVANNFKPSPSELPAVYDYDMALDRYKLALYNTVVKKGSVSEKAFICLKLSWLCRGKGEEILSKGATEDSEAFRQNYEEEMSYYEQAYEGMMKAVASESFPICGMDQYTMDFLLAQMAFKLEKYDMSSKLVSRLLTSQGANRNIKDRALDLKQEIIQVIKGKG